MQRIEGQKVRIEAISYAPYLGEVTPGLTKVFYRNKLLYTIDKYYRDILYTSDDGRYIAFANTEIEIGPRLLIRDKTGKNKDSVVPPDLNLVAIYILKDGKPFKDFYLKEVVDTNILDLNGDEIKWRYGCQYEFFDKADRKCERCREVYGRKVLKTCNPDEIDSADCAKCKAACDFLQIEKTAENSVYVSKNKLHILTCQNTVIIIDFNTLELSKEPFEKVVPDLSKFNPPKLKRKYKGVNIPDKFAYPNLSSNISLDSALAVLFGLRTTVYWDKTDPYEVSIWLLNINKKGKYSSVQWAYVFDNRIPGFHTDSAVMKDMTKILNDWLPKQTFQTNLIPKGFEKYMFGVIIHLKEP